MVRRRHFCGIQGYVCILSIQKFSPKRGIMKEESKSWQIRRPPGYGRKTLHFQSYPVYLETTQLWSLNYIHRLNLSWHARRLVLPSSTRPLYRYGTSIHTCSLYWTNPGDLRERRVVFSQTYFRPTR